MTTHHVKVQRSLKMARFLQWLTLRSVTYYITHVIQNSLLHDLINNVVKVLWIKSDLWLNFPARKPSTLWQASGEWAIHEG